MYSTPFVSIPSEIGAFVPDVSKPAASKSNITRPLPEIKHIIVEIHIVFFNSNFKHTNISGLWVPIVFSDQRTARCQMVHFLCFWIEHNSNRVCAHDNACQAILAIVSVDWILWKIGCVATIGFGKYTPEVPSSRFCPSIPRDSWWIIYTKRKGISNDCGIRIKSIPIYYQCTFFCSDYKCVAIVDRWWNVRKTIIARQICRVKSIFIVRIMIEDRFVCSVLVIYKVKTLSFNVPVKCSWSPNFLVSNLIDCRILIRAKP